MILDDYQSSYGAATDHPIVSQLQGEPTPSFSTDRPSRHQLYSSCKLKPRSDAHFRVKENELELEDMMLFCFMRIKISYPLWTGIPCRS